MAKKRKEVLTATGSASKGAVPIVCAHGSLARQCRVCELEQEVAAANGDAVTSRESAMRWQAKSEQQHATIATLRAALARVEWVDGQCPWCRAWRSNAGHWPDCARQAALGVGTGEGE